MKSPNLTRAIFIILILCSLESNIKGQENQERGVKSVFITGFTYESKTQQPLSNASFKINNKISYTSNESGRFSFYGNPGDTVVFTYTGYHPTKLIVPDTLKSEEYVMGVFMQEKTEDLAEIIILQRLSASPIIVTPVPTDQKTMDIAQSHINDAVVKGLTQPIAVYDADMNAKKTLRTNQMRVQYKGMMVTPEHAVGLSTQSYQTHHMLFGSPITTLSKISGETITNSEIVILLDLFGKVRRLMPFESSADAPVSQ